LPNSGDVPKQAGGYPRRETWWEDRRQRLATGITVVIIALMKMVGKIESVLFILIPVQIPMIRRRDLTLHDELAADLIRRVTRRATFRIEIALCVTPIVKILNTGVPLLRLVCHGRSPSSPASPQHRYGSMSARVASQGTRWTPRVVGQFERLIL
jgi:hypothetical protein